jgi:aryl-alcohol dehydrogenase-like predicted oxidoreductase
MVAAQIGILNIDTAPSYGKSQYLLGQVLKESPKFMVSTKVGKAGKFLLDGKIVLESVEKSLKSLCLKKVDCVFIHSVEFPFVKDTAIEALLSLKKLGVINAIGVSCDGDDFKRFYNLEVFDRFMMTLNLVDQINLNSCYIASNSGSKVILKRSLANGVFRNNYKAVMLKYMRIYKKEILGNEQESYYFRHKVLSQTFGNRLKYYHYANFAFQAVPKSEVLIGTKSITHLKSFRNIEKFSKFSKYELEKFKDLFFISNSYNWKAQT